MVEIFPVELFQKVFCDVGTVWSGIVMDQSIFGTQRAHSFRYPRSLLTIEYKADLEISGNSSESSLVVNLRLPLTT